MSYEDWEDYGYYEDPYDGSDEDDDEGDESYDEPVAYDEGDQGEYPVYYDEPDLWQDQPYERVGETYDRGGYVSQDNLSAGQEPFQDAYEQTYGEPPVAEARPEAVAPGETGEYASVADMYRALWGDDAPDDQSARRGQRLLAAQAQQVAPDSQRTTEGHVETSGPVTFWADGTAMDEKAKKQARVYQIFREEGFDAEGARAAVAVTEVEGGLFGQDNMNDPGGSYGPFQLNAKGQLPGFGAWLVQQGLPAADTKGAADDIDLSARYAAQTYLGAKIREAQAAGIHGAALATYIQRHGQVSITPEKAGAAYESIFKDGDRYEQAITAAVPSRPARQQAADALPAGHYDGDDPTHDHGVATPYTQSAVDRAGNEWIIAFDFNAKYDNPFNPAIPRHRGVDLTIPNAEARGLGKNGMGAQYTAFRSGTVAHITNDVNGGIGIIVATGDPDAPYDRYFHNNTSLVKEGDRVVAGETMLGIVGETGTQGFPHLHYEVSKNVNGDPMGQTIDPRPYMSRRVEPPTVAAVSTAPIPAPRTIPLETPHTSGKRTATTGIMIHATRGAGPTPEDEFNSTVGYFRGNSSKVSANAIIAADGTVALISDWDAAAHHAGENNGTMYGIELAQSAADAAAGKPFTDAQYASLGWLMGEVSKRYGLPLTRTSVIGHEESEQGKRSVDGQPPKSDPGPQFNYDRAIALARSGQAPVAAAAVAPARPVPAAAAAPAAAPAAPWRPFTPDGRRNPAPPGTTGTQGTVSVAAQNPPGAPQKPQTAADLGIDDHTFGALREWQTMRAQRGLDQTDIGEFRAHLGRIGAPDPWLGREQAQAAVVRQNAENRTKFLASLPEPTQKAYAEWEAMRKARGEDAGDITEFRAHLDRLGAPNPWREQEERVAASKVKYEAWLQTLPPSTRAVLPAWQAERTAKGEDPEDLAALSAHLDHLGVENPFKPRPGAAPGQAAPTQGPPQYTVTENGVTRVITEAEKNQIEATNAQIERANRDRRDVIAEQNRLVQDFNDRAAQELEALNQWRAADERWRQLMQSGEVDPANLGPQPVRPATPTLNRQQAGDAPRPIVGSDDTGYRQVVRGGRAGQSPEVQDLIVEEQWRARDAHQGLIEGAHIARVNQIKRETGLSRPVQTVVVGHDLQGYPISQTIPTPELEWVTEDRLLTQRNREGTEIGAEQQIDAAQRAAEAKQPPAPPPKAGMTITPTGPRAGPDPVQILASEQYREREARRQENRRAVERGEEAPFPDDELPEEYAPYNTTLAETPSLVPGANRVLANAQWVIQNGGKILQDPGRPLSRVRDAAIRSMYDTYEAVASQGAQLLGANMTDQGNAPPRPRGINPLTGQPDTSEYRPFSGELTPVMRTIFQTVGPALEQFGLNQGVVADQRRLEYQRNGFNIVRAPEMPISFTDPVSYAEMFIEGVPMLATGLGTAILGGIVGGPVGAAAASSALMFGAEGGGAYREALDAGVSREDARVIGNAVGLVNAALESLPTIKWIGDAIGPEANRLVGRALGKPLTGSLASQIDNPIVGQILRRGADGFQEGSEEVLQGLVTNSAAALYDGNKDLTEGLLEGFVGGFLPGAAMTSTQSMSTRFQTPGQILAQEGVRVVPYTDTWDKFLVQHLQPDGTVQNLIATVDAAGKVTTEQVAQMTETPEIPRVDTAEARNQAVRNVGLVYQSLEEASIISQEGQRQAYMSFVAAAQEGLALSRDGASRATRVANEIETRTAQPVFGENGIWSVFLPTSWNPAVDVEGTPLQLHARGEIPQAVAEATAKDPTWKMLGTAVSNLERIMTTRLQEAGVLPPGADRPLGLMMYGGLMNGLSHGNSAPGKIPGSASAPDALSIDIGQIIMNTQLAAEEKGIDWRTSPEFPKMVADLLVTTVAHEVGHDLFRGNKGHGPEHEAAIKAFSQAVMAEHAAIRDMTANLWNQGFIQQTLVNQLTVMRDHSPNNEWRMHAYAKLQGIKQSDLRPPVTATIAGRGGLSPVVGAVRASDGRPDTGGVAGVPGSGGIGGVQPTGAAGRTAATAAGRPAVGVNPLRAAANRAARLGVRRIRDEANEYVARNGIRPAIPRTAYVENDVETQRRIAQFYDQAESTPDDPETQRAYAQMAREVDAQYQFLTDRGVQFVPYYASGPAGDGADFNGYASSQDMVRDLAENNRLYVYADSLEHPLLGGGPAPQDNANWRFRAVHDYFGHAANGYAFGPRGEESAWLEHAKMFSPLAARAMTTETRGQNSWVNYRPESEDVALADRQFADQKVLILPGWALTNPEAYPGEHQSIVSGTVEQLVAPDGSFTMPVNGTRQSAEYAAAQAGQANGLPEVVVTHLSPRGNTAVATMTVIEDTETALALAQLFTDQGYHASVRETRDGAEVFVVGRDMPPAEFQARARALADLLGSNELAGPVTFHLADVVTFRESDYAEVIRRGAGEPTGAGVPDIGPPTDRARVGTGTGGRGADAAQPGSEGALAGVGTAEAGTYGGLVPSAVARLQPGGIQLPTDDAEFQEALANTPGAVVTEDGLELPLVRQQRPEQDGMESVRTGVFYMLADLADAISQYAKGGTQTRAWYGGTQRIEGPSTFRRPMFVKGATGGRVPEKGFNRAWAELHGAQAGEPPIRRLDQDIRLSLRDHWDSDETRAVAVAELLRRWGYRDDASTPNPRLLAENIVENSREGNQLNYAIREAVTAQALRDAGYDAVIGLTTTRGKVYTREFRFGEVFDVREVTYPAEGADGQTMLHDRFRPQESTYGGMAVDLPPPPPIYDDSGAIIRPDTRGAPPLAISLPGVASQTNMAQVVSEEDRSAFLGPEYRPVRLPNGAVIHLDPGVSPEDAQLLMASPGIAQLAQALRSVHDEALAAAANAGWTTPGRSRFIGLVFDDQRNGFLYYGEGERENDVGINPTTLTDHWDRQTPFVESPQALRGTATQLQYAVAHEVAHNWNAAEGRQHEQNIAQLRRLLPADTIDRIDAALQRLHADGDLALVMPNAAARGRIAAHPQRIPYSLTGDNTPISEMSVTERRERAAALYRRADASQREIEQMVQAGTLDADEADTYFESIDDMRYRADGMQLTPEEMAAPQAQEEPSAPAPLAPPIPGLPAAILPQRPGSLVIDPERGVLMVHDAGDPPLLSNEDAIAQGWAGIPQDPASPVLSTRDLYDRLQDVPFLSNRDVALILGQRPQDMDQVIQYMLDQRAKVTEGRLDPSDLAKAYLMTTASQGQGAIRASIVQDVTGLAIPDHFLTVNAQGERVVRPEDAMAAWIASPGGQNTLDALNRGQYDAQGFEDAIAIRAAFSDNRLENLNILGNRPNRPGRISMRDIPALTERLNRIGNNPDALHREIGRLNGIGRGKSGFMEHLLGFGENPTMDSRIINTWLTGQAEIRGLDTEGATLARAINQHLGGGHGAVGYLALARIVAGYDKLRRAGFAPDVPRSVYNAVMHSWLWNRVKGIPTMSAPIYGVMADRVAPVTAPAEEALPVTERQDWWAGWERQQRDLDDAMLDPEERAERYAERQGVAVGLTDEEFAQYYPEGLTYQGRTRNAVPPEGDRLGGMVPESVARMLPVTPRTNWPENWEEILANHDSRGGGWVRPTLLPNGGIKIPVAIRSQNASNAGLLSPRLLNYYRFNPSYQPGAYNGSLSDGRVGITKGEKGMVIKGETVLMNPLIYQGGVWASDHAAQISQAEDVEGYGEEILDDVLDSLTRYGVTPNNIAALLARNGGDPWLAPTIYRAAGGELGARKAGMADLIITQILGNSLRRNGYDGVISWTDTNPRTGKAMPPHITEGVDAREYGAPNAAGEAALHPEMLTQLPGGLVDVWGWMAEFREGSRIRAKMQLRENGLGQRITGYEMEDGQLLFRGEPTGYQQRGDQLVYHGGDQDAYQLQLDANSLPKLVSQRGDMAGSAGPTPDRSVAAEAAHLATQLKFYRYDGRTPAALGDLRTEIYDTVDSLGLSPEVGAEIEALVPPMRERGSAEAAMAALAGDDQDIEAARAEGAEFSRAVRDILARALAGSGPAASIGPTPELPGSEQLTGLGLDPMAFTRGGQGVPHPGYAPNTPEAQVEAALQNFARLQDTPTPSVSAAQMQALSPVMPDPMAIRDRQARDRNGNPKVNRDGDPVIEQSWHGYPASLDDLRTAVEVGMPHRRWYTNFGTWATNLVGPINANEFRVLFGITSSRTPVNNNLTNTVSLMRWARELAAEGDGSGLLDQNAWQAKKDAERYEAWDDKNERPKLNPDGTPQMNKFAITNAQMLKKVVDGYRDGIVLNESNAKTASYSGNVLAGALQVYDPNSTIDTWMGQLIGWSTDRFANDDQAYRVAHAIFNWLAREKGLNPNEVQAAGWFTIKTITERAPDLRNQMDNGEITLGDAIRAAQERDLFGDVRGDLADVVRQPGVANAVEKLKAVIDKNAPGPGKAGEMGMIYPGDKVKSLPYAFRPISNEQVAAGRTSAEAQAPTVTFLEGASSLGVQNGRLPWLTVPHVLTPHATGFSVSLPGGTFETAQYAAALIGERAGLDSMLISTTSSQAPNVAGVVFRDESGPMDDETRMVVTNALAQADVPFVVGPNGSYVAALMRDPEDTALADRAVDSVRALNIESLSAEGYTGDVEEIQRSDYAGALEALGHRYGPGGPSGLQEPSVNRSTAGPEGPVASSGNPAGSAGKIPGPPASGTWGSVDPDTFISLVNRSEREGYLSPLTPEDLVDRRIYVQGSESTGFVGFTLTPEGDLGSLFNAQGASGQRVRGAGTDAVFLAIADGATTLAAYDGFLPDYYHQFGFVETGRIAQSAGVPDVVLMAWTGFHEGDTVDGIRQRLSDRTQSSWRESQSAQQYDSWEDAVAARDAILRGGGSAIRRDRDAAREGVRGVPSINNPRSSAASGLRVEPGVEPQAAPAQPTTDPALWTEPDQEIDSAGTSQRQTPGLITRGVPWQQGQVNFDLGGGKWEDATEYLASERGVTNLVYDPFNRTEEHNADVLAQIQALGGADVVTVANVLNVIQEPAARAQVIEQARAAVKPGNAVYFSVYAGDGSGVGKATFRRNGTPIGWQENRPLATYLEEIQAVFPEATRRGDMIVAPAPAAAPSRMAGSAGPTPDSQLERDLRDPQLLEDIATRANAVLDDWEQDEDGYSDVFGGGGVCDTISDVIAAAIYERVPDVNAVDGGQDGDDHAYPIIYRDGVAYAVDIHPGVYETGAGYSWTKIEGAQVTPQDIDIWPVQYEYLGIEDEQDGMAGSAGPTPVPTFYSALWRAIDEDMPVRAGAAQIYGILGRTIAKRDSKPDPQGNILIRRGDVVWQRAVRPEELRWTGFDQYLDAAEREGRLLSKENVQQFLRENAVKMEEVVLGDNPAAGVAGTDLEAVDRDRRIAEQARENLQQDIAAALVEEGEREMIARTHGRYYAAAVVGLATNNQEMLDEVGLTAEVAVSERSRLLANYPDLTDSVGRTELAYSQYAMSQRVYGQLTSAERRPTRWDTYPHEQLVLPGGTNQREILMIIPDLSGNVRGVQAEISRLRAQLAELEASSEPTGHAITSVRNAIYLLETENTDQGLKFTHPHWQGFENVIGHLRANDRVSRRGLRLFFLEEIQSDWHQIGHKKGYLNGAESQRVVDADARLAEAAHHLNSAFGVRPDGTHNEVFYTDAKGLIVEAVEIVPADTEGDSGLGFFYTRDEIAEMRRAREGLFTTREYDPRTGNYLYSPQAMTREQWEATFNEPGVRRLATTDELDGIREYERLRQERLVIRRELADNERVPEAPFEKNWGQMLLRRALRWAAEHGYDALAWTPGDVQNDRYHLIKQADGVTYDTKDGKTGLLRAYRYSEEVGNWENVAAERIPEYIGQEMYEQLFAVEPMLTALGDHYTADSRETFDVGGVGNRSFYDKMMVNSANNMAKNWNTRVGTDQIDIPGETSQRYELVDATGNVLGTYDTVNSAQRAQSRLETMGTRAQVRPREETGEATVQDVWVVPITPEMTESVVYRGQMAFSAGPTPAALVDPFFSQLRKVITDDMPNRASAAQVYGLLGRQVAKEDSKPNKKTGIVHVHKGDVSWQGSVKPDEINWSGLGDWLDAQPEGLINKRDVLAYLDRNAIKLDEVVLGQRGGITREPNEDDANIVFEGSDELYPDDPDAEAVAVNYYRATLAGLDVSYDTRIDADGMYHITRSGEQDPFVREYDEEGVEQAIRGDIYGMARRAFRQQLPVEKTPRYRQYTHPGGDNYREVLLTYDTTPAGFRALDAYRETLREKYGEQYWREMTLEETDAENALVAKMGKKPEDYRGGHWTEPNVLAHIRVIEHIAEDGVLTLVVEEIQSDWHQTGRKKGYLDGSEPDFETLDQQLAAVQAQIRNFRDETGQLQELRRAAEAAFQEQERVGRTRGTHTLGSPEYDAFIREYQQAARAFIVAGDAEKARERELLAPLRIQEDSLRQQMDDLEEGRNKRVPDAPFKATEQWAGLAFRRAIRYAAENGFTRIAWTTGAQQADRYSLDRLMDSLSYNPETHRLIGSQAGRRVVDESLVTPADLAGHVGEELAERLMAAEPNVNGLRTIEGEQLKTEQKGMRAFYDKILVNIANKLGKAYGVQVSTTRIGGPPAVDSAEDSRIYLALDDQDRTIGEYATLDEAQVAALEFGPGAQVEVVGGEDPRVWDVLREDGSVAVTYTNREAAEQAAAQYPGQSVAERIEADPGIELHSLNIPAEMRQDVLFKGQSMFMAGPTPEMNPIDDDPYEYVDPEWIDMLDSYGAYEEIEFDDPRSDDPISAVGMVADAAQEPILGPPDPRYANMDLFPDWARSSLQMGELADPIGDNPDSVIQDIQTAIMNGPNAKKLEAGDVNALRGAILLQYNRLVRASERTQGGRMTPWAAAQLIDNARRYTALMALATTPMDQWNAVGEVWRSAPVSQGEGGTLQEFMQRRAQASTPEERAQLEREGIARAAAIIGTNRRGGKGPGGTAQERVAATGSAIGQAATGPAASPTRTARSIAYDADLSITPAEVILGMRYNNLLLGPRGILVDYGTNSIMLLYKAMSDPLLPEQGGLNPKARWAITKAEYAAGARMWPLMLQRIGRLLWTGVSDLETDATGAPRSISGRLNLRIENRETELQALGLTPAEIARDRELVTLRGKRLAAVPFIELAGRLKSVADVGIKTIAFGMEQTRQAGVMAWREGTHPVGSDAWHMRVAEILEGKGITRDVYEQMKANSTREAERITFQGKMGTIGRKYLEPIQNHPIGSFVLPFLRALYHIRGWALDFSPAGPLLTVGDVARAGAYRGLKTTERGERFLNATGNMKGLLGGPYQTHWKGASSEEGVGGVGFGVSDLDRRMVANVLGTTAYLWILGAAFAGGISGAGPPDEPIPWWDEGKPDPEAIKLAGTMAARGWQRYSVRMPWIDGKYHWVSYSNWGPLAYILASAAAIAEAHKYGLPKEKKQAADTAGKMWELITQGDAGTAKTATRRAFGVVKDMSYLSGFIDLYKLMQSAADYHFGGEKGESEGDEQYRERKDKADMARYAGNILVTFLPLGALVNTIAQSQDPYERATETGSIRDQFAARIPDLSGLPPSIAPPFLAAAEWAGGNEYGSRTGQRSGLPIKVDSAGRPVANPYSGIFGVLPFRATTEEVGNRVLDALIEAEVGIPTAPQDLIYRPLEMATDSRGRIDTDKRKRDLVVVQITPRMRQELGQKIGQRIDERVGQLLDEVPESERQADPVAWKDRLASEMKTIYDAEKRAYSEDAVNSVLLIQPLLQDSARVRPFEPAPKPTETPVPSLAPPDGSPVLTGTPEPTGGTPRPTTTPRPTSATPRPTVSARETSSALGTPTPTPRASTTPTPRPGTTPRPGGTPRPGATSAPAAPGGKTQTEIDRERIRQRAGAGAAP